MSRAFGTVVVLLGVVLALPALAQGIQGAAPALLALLLAIAIVRLALPPRRRR